MKLPELTPSNAKAIFALTTMKPSDDDPLIQFQKFATKFPPGALRDDPEYSSPLYPDFEDPDYQHDVSTLNHVYLNDFDFNLEEDRETLTRLTRLELDSNTFETIARCSCPPNTGGIQGNYLIGSGRVCPKCGDEAQKFLEKGEDTNMWIKPPEGVTGFINLGFYITFFSNIIIGNPSPKICVPRFFIDPTYQRAERKKKNGTMIVMYQMLEDLKITEPSLNSFIEHCDRIMEYLLLGPGRRYTKKPQEGLTLMGFYLNNKHLAFPKYLPVPARYNTVFEKTSKGICTYTHQPATSQLYYAIADSLKSTPVRKLTSVERKKNLDIVGKSLVALATQYREINNPKAIFNKPGINRKHVAAGAIPWTGRSVITSQTGIIDTDCLIVPWKMAVNALEYNIKGYLYRLGFTPVGANKLINKAAFEIVPEIDNFFKDMEKSNKCLVESGRNPSIEYLSLRVFYLRVNRDLTDESIKLPIPSVKAYNADFDGKCTLLPSLNFSNCWEPLKLIWLQRNSQG